MGKKKEDRVVISGHSHVIRKERKDGDKEKPNDYCFLLAYKDKRKSLINFQWSDERKFYQRRYIRFNYDKQRQTPAFIYENDLRPIDKYREHYITKLKAAKQQINNPVQAPQPRQKKNKLGFCAICKSNFEKYFDHTNTKEHIRKMTENEFSKGLKKIEDFYQYKRQRKARIQKTYGQSVRAQKQLL